MNGTYYTITEVFDFGPHISKVILDYGKSMKGAAPSPEQFTVHVTRTSTEGEDFVWPNFMGDKPDDSMDAHAAFRTFTFLTKPVYRARTAPV